jgi:hypothetical protein
MKVDTKLKYLSIKVIKNSDEVDDKVTVNLTGREFVKQQPVSTKIMNDPRLPKMIINNRLLIGKNKRIEAMNEGKPGQVLGIDKSGNIAWINL